jgi:transposase
MHQFGTKADEGGGLRRRFACVETTEPTETATASGGQPGSPLAADEMPASWPSSFTRHRGVARRRRLTAEQKLAVVAETMQPGMSISYVARRHGLSPSLVFRWRR